MRISLDRLKEIVTGFLEYPSKHGLVSDEKVDLKVVVRGFTTHGKRILADVLYFVGEGTVAVEHTGTFEITMKAYKKHIQERGL